VLVGLVVGCAAALLWCALYWHGTLGFLYGQVTNAEAARPDWYLHFQRYLWGLDDAEWRGAGSVWTAYGLLSAPVDLLSGAFGLYFALPAPTRPLAVRVGLKILLAVFLLVLTVQATRALVGVLREEHRARGAFLLGGLVCCAMPVALALLDRLWQAGKLLSMVAPLLFLWLVLPLVTARRLDLRCASALLLVLAHLGFGLHRPVAARAADGIHYPLPYPGVQQPALKKAISWDLAHWQRYLSSCRLVNLNVRHALVHAYAEMLLSEACIPWSPSRPTLSYDRERILAPEEPERSSRADCQLLDSLRRRERRPGGTRFLFVGRGGARQVPPSLLDGVHRTRFGLPERRCEYSERRDNQHYKHEPSPGHLVAWHMVPR
jgi:hypothetical protein